MKMRTSRALLSWVPALIGMGILFYTSSLPGDRVHLPPFPYSDKAVHFSAYAILGALISLRKPLRRRLEKAGNPAEGDLDPHRGGPVERNPGPDPRSLAAGMLYGVADEIHQLFVPLRSYDYTDMAADALGVTVGCWLFGLVSRRFLKQADGPAGTGMAGTRLPHGRRYP